MALHRNFSFFILMFAVTLVHSQVNIEGKVVDFAFYVPIESASIYIQNTTVGTITNTDGKFELLVPKRHQDDTLVVSSIGYKSFKVALKDYVTSDIFLTEDVASLDEVMITSEPRPKTGNDIVLKAISKIDINLPDSAYIQKGFLRHKERNKGQYKWLIESAITVYDSVFSNNSAYSLKVNVDENRKSYDLRDLDSLFIYSAYLKNYSNISISPERQLNRDTIATASLIKAIHWNDKRTNGLDNLLKGQLNLVRNWKKTNALFGPNVLSNHQFQLDTLLVENGRKLYKIKINNGETYVDLDTPGVYNKGFHPEGWLYIYWDNFAFKKIEYVLRAASPIQKRRSKSLYDTDVNHKLELSYIDYNGKMYPNYVYYETPKLVNVGDRSNQDQSTEQEKLRAKQEQFYYTVQELLFTEIIENKEKLESYLQQEWSSDIFIQRSYNQNFWDSYNVLLESEEEQKLIEDLSKRATLFEK